MVVLLAGRTNPTDDVSQHYDLQYRNEPNNIIRQIMLILTRQRTNSTLVICQEKKVREKREYNADRKGLTSILLPRTMADPCDILPGSLLSSSSVSCLKWYFTFKIEGFSFMPCPLCGRLRKYKYTRDSGFYPRDSHFHVPL